MITILIAKCCKYVDKLVGIDLNVLFLWLMAYGSADYKIHVKTRFSFICSGDFSFYRKSHECRHTRRINQAWAQLKSIYASIVFTICAHATQCLHVNWHAYDSNGWIVMYRNTACSIVEIEVDLFITYSLIVGFSSFNLIEKSFRHFDAQMLRSACVIHSI